MPEDDENVSDDDEEAPKKQVVPLQNVLQERKNDPQYSFSRNVDYERITAR